jgi:serine/threonine-protein kinase
LAEQLGLAHWLYIRRDDTTMVQAQAAAERALALQPDLPEAHRAMGSVWYRQREYAKALAEFAIVRKAQPNSADLLSAIGFVERRQGEWDSAVVHMTRARDLDPGSANALSQLGETFGILHRHAEAAAQFQRAMEIAPDQPDAYYFQAISLISDRGDTAAARATLRRWTARLPAARLLVGNIQNSIAVVVAGDDGLSQAMETTIAGDPNGASVQRTLLLADVRRLRGDQTGATRLYDSLRTTLRQLLAQMPDDYGYQAQLGRVLAHLGDTAGAIRAAKRAVELLPPERDAYFGVNNVVSLATVYAVLGQAGPSVTELRRAFAYRTVVTRHFLRLDATWDPIRNDPGFQAFMTEAP